MILLLNQILMPVLVLGVLGALAAGILCLVVRKFAVKEDSRIAQVEELLPGANCGACGFLGCHDFAVQCVKLGGPVGIVCPGAGDGNMCRIAAIFGAEAEKTKPKVAVLRCAGSCTLRHPAAIYSGPQGCRMESIFSAGPLTCAYGCLECGECEAACRFGAISMDSVTRLPVIDEDKCTACGVCVQTCPRGILDIVPKGPKGRRVWVACSNRQRGAVARKGCQVACIACGKCVKTCPFGAITLSGNVAVIDPDKCRLCRKCVAVCPTGAIHTANFPVLESPKTAES